MRHGNDRSVDVGTCADAADIADDVIVFAMLLSVFEVSSSVLNVEFPLCVLFGLGLLVSVSVYVYVLV